MNEHPDQHHPDTSADTSPARGGVVRTPVIVGETVDCHPILTRADTARTRPDTDTEDTSPGVRVEYRARVPRRQLSAALTEALGHIAAAETTATYAPDTVRTGGDHHVRRAQTSAAINAAFDVPTSLHRTGHPDAERPDAGRTSEPTSFLGQMTEAMLTVWHQRTEDAVTASPAEHCAALAAAALGHTADILPPTGHHHVSGRCPACNRTALFLADGGYVTCSHLDCPRPDAAADLLDH